MAHWSKVIGTLRKKKSSKKRPWRKWQWKNDSINSCLSSRGEQHSSSVYEQVGKKRKRGMLSDNNVKSGVSPLIRDKSGLQESNEFKNLSVFDRLGFKRRNHCARGISHHSYSKSGVSPLIRDKFEWSVRNFQMKQPFNGKAKFRKKGSYRRVQHSKENVFVKIGDNRNLHKSDILNGVKSGVSVFDRLGSKKRRNFYVRNTYRHRGFKSSVSPLIRDGLEWPNPSFKQQPLRKKAKFRKRGKYRRGKHFGGNIFVKIDNSQNLFKTDVIDMYEIDNDNQFQSQTDAEHSMCDNDCVGDSLHVKAVPNFVPEISPAGMFDFNDGVRSFQSEKFCVELYPSSPLGSS